MNATERLAAAQRELAEAQAAVAAEHESQWAVRGAEAGRREAQRRHPKQAADESKGTGPADGDAAPLTGGAAGKAEAQRRIAARGGAR